MLNKDNNDILNKERSEEGQPLKYEFHIAGFIRKEYELAKELFSFNGNVVFADFPAVRSFVAKVNEKREDHRKIKTGDVNAVGLIDEIYHYLLSEYEKNVNPGVMKRAYDSLLKNIGDEKLNKVLFDFVNIFPPLDVYTGKISTFDYLNSMSGGKSNEIITLEEMMLVYFANYNSAAKNVKELYDDSYLEYKKEYEEVVASLNKFFEKEKPFGPDRHDLFTLFKSPMDANPNSLEDQLEYIFNRWGVILTDEFHRKILSGKDLIKEDFSFGGFGGGDFPLIVPKYKGDFLGSEGGILGKSLFDYASDSTKAYDEPEQFTEDMGWMPRVVLIAKNAYVWLDQLSKKYSRPIKRLDQIPDEELDQLARWNFNGLWLIGVWERSTASKKIKHLMGNIDAVGSAYSLFDYQIANDIGGEEAYENLNERAKARGIRLASDMVPNHTGIFSKWVLEHPDYFIQSDTPPFPSYKFTGEDLSDDNNFQIRLEDGYWTKSDAAVVFQVINNNTGEIRYLYHGNDGTNMPWNDTAQLNLLKGEVREAVIQKIMDVAKKFSIIRFDAAMTLTKKHFSRLWYPEPGKGGDIPSRADYALTRAEFDNAFPVEFWREVVDRMNNEMPDTLLLAEAFWLMEGYFVRSLGMHRVYNSAFMHMMMKEENEKYRDLITNTLEFEPEILKRYVNFMSNPDEETAIKQFGTDDKYFGVLTLMITLPGLPMFAHGQIEGYIEKYGMEYQRAYYNETPKDWLVERHQREIFPLMKKRYLFSQVENFWLYDCIDDFGNINENVFAYTNSIGDDKALVLYNNKYDQATGKVTISTPKLVNNGNDGKDSKLISISDALGIKNDENYFYILKDAISREEYIWKGSEVAAGIPVRLDGFKYKVFTDFREVFDVTGELNEIHRYLNGNSVESVERYSAQRKLAPIHEAVENLFIEKELNALVKNLVTEINTESAIEEDIKFTWNKFYLLLEKVKQYSQSATDSRAILNGFAIAMENVKVLNYLLRKNISVRDIKMLPLFSEITVARKSNYKENLMLLLLLNTLTKLGELLGNGESWREQGVFEKLLLGDSIEKILHRLGRGTMGVNREITLLRILLEYQDKLFNMIDGPEEFLKLSEKEFKNFIVSQKGEVIRQLFDDEFFKAFIGVNEYQGILYYSKESLEEVANWMMTIVILKYLESEFSKVGLDLTEENTGKETKLLNQIEEEKAIKYIGKVFSLFDRIKGASTKAEYQLTKLKKNLLEK